MNEQLRGREFAVFTHLAFGMAAVVSSVCAVPWPTCAAITCAQYLYPAPKRLMQLRRRRR
jgi:hypothetical protein